ncbi:MAG TPA: hypothetical protein VJ826_15390 [Candidatus Polarisedimenticolaceae bacterium]|nr:hypothetical protein [Candidatus Polarisedimenticolaceae bacterium]
MENVLKRYGVSLALALVAVLSVSVAGKAEVVRTLHTSPQLIMNEASIMKHQESTAGIGISDTLDLSGGDLDVVDFQLHITSGAHPTSSTFDLTIKTSADGGTTWASAGTFTQVTSSQTATNVVKTGTIVAPGTKVRLESALSAGTTWYEVKVWAMPRSK